MIVEQSASDGHLPASVIVFTYLKKFTSHNGELHISPENLHRRNNLNRADQPVKAALPASLGPIKDFDDNR